MEPTLPTSTFAVLSPMRMRSGDLPSARHPLLTRSIRRVARRAPEHARSTWSGNVTGAPQNAMMPSPMNLSTVPFSSEIARETCSKYTDICSSNASAVDFSACDETFSRSENRMVRLRFSTPRASGIPDLSPDHVHRRKGRKRLERIAQQRSRRLKLGDFSDVGRAAHRLLEGQAFDRFEFLRDVHNRLREAE